MREILSTLNQWFSEGKKVALATVVKVYGSAPRGLGAKMAVNQDGTMVGSVSGGCVESAVVAEALQIIKNGQAKLLTYGISQDQAFNIGLACGGKIEVFVTPLAAEEYYRLEQDLGEERLTCIISVIAGPMLGEHWQAYPDGRLVGDFSSTEIQNTLLTTLPEVLSNQQSLRQKAFSAGEENELFFDVFLPSLRLIVVGAVHIAIPLIQFANTLGFHTILVDPRKGFNNRERFPHVTELVQDWPEEALQRLGLNEGTFLVVISHDDKLDVPALAAGCASPVRYIGALGSRKTFENHLRDLREMGVSEATLQRIHSPVGLDIGARGAEEIALAIIAEIIAVKNGTK
jgi:xanthine dehydrogenase accessory factor